ncbi:hypothetical protein DICSQDRAFT_11605, partial [Dichomitus squalens LYAD-421 SS1]
VAQVLGGWPFGDGLDFDRVHGHLAFADDEAEVLYLRLLKLALLWSQVEVVFL